jgi:hypothetical protein
VLGGLISSRIHSLDSDDEMNSGWHLRVLKIPMNTSAFFLKKPLTMAACLKNLPPLTRRTSNSAHSDAI